MTPGGDRAMLEEGVARFNAGAYWEAHESWERIWLTAEGTRRQLLQGLIQLAAVFYHLERGNFRGAARLATAARGRLLLNSSGELGVDFASALDAALTCVEAEDVDFSLNRPALSLIEPPTVASHEAP